VRNGLPLSAPAAQRSEALGSGDSVESTSHRTMPVILANSQQSLPGSKTLPADSQFAIETRLLKHVERVGSKSCDSVPRSRRTGIQLPPRILKTPKIEIATKPAPMTLGTHHSSLFVGSISKCAVLAQPSSPGGYSRLQNPTAKNKPKAATARM
jgi:hypothetical protein